VQVHIYVTSVITRRVVRTKCVSIAFFPPMPFIFSPS